MLPKLTAGLPVGVRVLLASSFAVFLAREDWAAAFSAGLILLLLFLSLLQFFAKH